MSGRGLQDLTRAPSPSHGTPPALKYGVAVVRQDWIRPLSGKVSQRPSRTPQRWHGPRKPVGNGWQISLILLIYNHLSTPVTDSGIVVPPLQTARWSPSLDPLSQAPGGGKTYA